jgi:hypothetical protein
MSGRGVLEVLKSQGPGLFALLDAGRDPEVLTVLYKHSCTCRSLYQGESEATLGPSGPYLVELGDDAALLSALVRKGWERSWGVFVASQASFEELRRHFRGLLMVRREKDKSELYFRFYDPRVLRAFLPTCSAEQVRPMFGPVRAYLVEAADGSVLRFAAEVGGVECRTLVEDAAHA